MAASRAVTAAWLSLAALALAPRVARAQDVPDAWDDAPDASTDADTSDAGASDGSPAAMPTACPDDSAGCAFAPIAFDHRVGLPVEFDFDTGWQPSSSPVQVRFHAALVGHTEVRAAGWLEGSWPTPIVLRAPGQPGTGMLSSDWGVQLMAQVRLHVTVSGTTYDWTGDVPYVPHVDFRASASQGFDPWAWDTVDASGTTSRQHIADVPLTDGLIPIPGISGGLSFDAQADLDTGYHSTDITFGGAADPLTASIDHVQGYFSAGSTVDFYPRLEGHVDWSTQLRIYPGLYIEIAGHRWTVDVFTIPVDLGPFGQDWQFDPSHAVFALPDVAARDIVVDFGDVTVGTSARAGAPFESDGEVPLVVAPPTGSAAPFSWPSASATIAPHTTVSLPVDFMPTAVGPAEAHVAFRTSDPDTPTLRVTLRGNGVAAPDAGAHDDAGASDAGTHDAGAHDGGTPGSANGGCGCRAAGGGSEGPRPTGGAWVLLAGIAVAVRRRRSSAPSRVAR